MQWSDTTFEEGRDANFRQGFLVAHRHPHLRYIRWFDEAVYMVRRDDGGWRWSDDRYLTSDPIERPALGLIDKTILAGAEGAGGIASASKTVASQRKRALFDSRLAASVSAPSRSSSLKAMAADWEDAQDEDSGYFE